MGYGVYVQVLLLKKQEDLNCGEIGSMFVNLAVDANRRTKIPGCEGTDLFKCFFADDKS